MPWKWEAPPRHLSLPWRAAPCRASPCPEEPHVRGKESRTVASALHVEVDPFLRRAPKGAASWPRPFPLQARLKRQPEHHGHPMELHSESLLQKRELGDEEKVTSLQSWTADEVGSVSEEVLPHAASQVLHVRLPCRRHVCAGRSHDAPGVPDRGPLRPRRPGPSRPQQCQPPLRRRQRGTGQTVSVDPSEVAHLRPWPCESHLAPLSYG